MSLTGKEKCAPNQDYTFIRSYVSFYHLIQKNQNRKSIFTFEPRFSQFNIHLMKKVKPFVCCFIFLNAATIDGSQPHAIVTERLHRRNVLDSNRLVLV